MSLALLARFWWAIPIVALSVWIGVQRAELHRAQATVVSLQAAIRSANTEATAKAAASSKATEAVYAHYQSALSSINILSDQLHDRVLQYEAVNRQNDHPSATRSRFDAAIGIQAAPAAAGSDETGELIANSLSACYRDDARLEALQEWATAVSQ